MSDIKNLLIHHPDKVEKMAKDIFDEVDLDKSDFIERDEMKKLLKEMAVQLGKTLTDEELDEEIDKIDQDGDGKIDLAEFTDVIKSILGEMAGL